MICNWSGFVNKEEWPSVVQVIEVTPQKKADCALREWKNTDLASASCIRLLDAPWTEEKLDSQR